MSSPRPLTPLPEFSVCRAQLLREGAPAHPPFVPSNGRGLLAELPAPPANAPAEWPWQVETTPVSAAESAGWPEIYVAMPSFKQGAFIEAALRSVLLQNYPRLRVVVCDAGSSDATPAVLERYRPWLSHVRCAPDGGQASALNLALSLAPAAGLLGWLNSDDLFLPGALHAVARAWCATRADLIYGDGLALEEHSRRLRHDAAGFAHPVFRRYSGTLLSHATFWSAALAQPFRPELHGSLDYEFWIRLLPRTRRRVHLAQPLGVIREHAEAKSHDPALAARWAEDAALNGAAHPQLYRPDPLRSRAHRWTTRAVRALRRGRSRRNTRAICAAARWPEPEFSP